MSLAPHPACEAPCCRFANRRGTKHEPARKVPTVAYDAITPDQYGGSASTYYREKDRCRAGIVHPWKGDGLYYRCGGRAESDGYCWRHAPEPAP